MHLASFGSRYIWFKKLELRLELDMPMCLWKWMHLWTLYELLVSSNGEDDVVPRLKYDLKSGKSSNFVTFSHVELWI